jgi:predicted amidohydrolase
MTAFATVRVAAVQATPVILDAEATVDKAVGLLAQAAEQGARLAVLPECFVSVYPSNAWARTASAFGGHGALWERLWEESVDVDGPLVARLVAACREHDLYCVVGVNEREDERPGSLYNTMLTLGPGGVLHRHRKLMPTMHERLFHGVGPGDDLAVTDLPGLGRVGGLICWENRMPLARYSVYRGGP